MSHRADKAAGTATTLFSCTSKQTHIDCIRARSVQFRPACDFPQPRACGIQGIWKIFNPLTRGGSGAEESGNRLFPGISEGDVFLLEKRRHG